MRKAPASATLAIALSMYLAASAEARSTSSCKIRAGHYLVCPGADLTNAELRGTIIVNVRGANLTGANLRGARLAYMADFRGSTLRAANFSHLEGCSARFDRANLNGADLSFSDFLAFDGCDGGSWTHARMRHASLYRTSLVSADLRGADLSYANASRARLGGSDLSGALVQGAHLADTNLAEIRSGQMRGNAANLSKLWKKVNGYLIGPSANLHRANLRNANLAGATIGYSCATNQPSRLCRGLNLCWGIPETLACGDLSEANLAGANLAGANLENEYIEGAHMANANLVNARLSGINGKIINSAGVRLPNRWGLLNSHLAGPGANLIRANLSSVNLSGVDLSGAILDSVSSGRIVGSPISLPSNWTLRYGYLLGPGANLKRAQLQNADLSTVSLGIRDCSHRFDQKEGCVDRGANLEGADLTEADLRSASLRGVSSGAVRGPPANLPKDWQFLRGFLVGPTAIVSGADLHGLRLTHADFRNASFYCTNFASTDLTYANLSGATIANFAHSLLEDACPLTSQSSMLRTNLTGTDLRRSQFGFGDRPIDMRGAVFNRSNLGSAEFWNVNLGHAAFQFADLTNSDLFRSDLRHSDFRRSNVRGADIVSSNLSFANFYGAGATGGQFKKWWADGNRLVQTRLPSGSIYR